MTTFNNGFRQTYYAVYDYPGLLFAESRTRDIGGPTIEHAIAGELDKGWYAVHIHERTEKLFRAADGEETWVKQDDERISRHVVGDRIHYSAIDDSHRNQILISNIRCNSTDGYGVLTRAGNWQIASDYDSVIPASAVR